MKKRLMTGVIIALLCACSLAGCVFVSRDFRQIRDVIVKDLGPVDVETEIQLRIGSGFLSLGRLAGKFVEEVDDEALSCAKDIRHVQVGVYKLQNMPPDKSIAIPEELEDRLARKGYDPMVKVKDRDEAVWVMTKVKGDHLLKLYVIVLERDELVLVEVAGRLDRLVERALREHGVRGSGFITL